MKLTGILLRKGVALPLLGVYMHQHRAADLLGPGQHITQPGQVVAVDGAQVRKAHVLKEGAAGPERLFQAGFQPVVEPVQGGFGGRFAEQASIPLFEVIISGLTPQPGQMVRNGAHIGVDGHAVVVQNDDQVLLGGPGVVQALIGKAAGQGAVADQSQHLIILML